MSETSATGDPFNSEFAAPGGLPPARLERFGLDNIPADTLQGLQALYSAAYHNAQMYEDLIADIERQPDVFQLLVARLDDQPEIVVGAEVIETKEHPFIDYLGYPPVHGKRFSVLPAFRSRGIGRQLITEGRRYAFEDLDLSVIFGESNEAGALSMYGREGSLYFLDSIKNSSRRNSPEDNVRFFAEFITNPLFRRYRYPQGDGIRLAYPRDEQTAQFFRQHGYVSKDDLLAKLGIDTSP